MKIYLAPMEGITNHIYRNAYEKYYGNIDKYFTPFIANKSLKTKELAEVLPENNKVNCLIPQILGNKSETVLSIISQLKDLGYREVNLNFGCPSKTVTPKGRGAGILANLNNLTVFLDEVFEKSELDISIKTRLGIESLSEWPDILKVYSKYPIKELIIHARLLEEQYKGLPHIECFKEAQNTLNIPLCYNGNIDDEESLNKLLEICPQTSSIMIGRGALKNPELAYNLHQFTNSKTSNQNTSLKTNHQNINTDSLQTFKAFHNEILENYINIMSGDTPTLFKMKELWSFWGTYLNLSPKDLKAIRKAKTIQEYKIAIQLI